MNTQVHDYIKKK